MTDHAIPPTPDYERLERLIEGDLDPAEAQALRAHIDLNPEWRDALDQVTTNRDMLRRLRDSPGAQSEPGSLDAPNIPGFDILHELHRGGQGVVYAALQVSTNRRVALKLLLQGRFASPIQRRRFEREIDLAASLDHPNIVRVFDRADTPAGEPYYIMELVDAQPLDAYIREHNPTRRQRIRLFRKIADAVSYAHQRAVIHRDLKPANILIDARAEPHVLDFGLAKPADLAATESLATEAGGFVGTLRYASPEQLLGEPARLDVRTDVYSLAVILYEMLTGRLPYAAESPLSALIRCISSDPPVRPRSITPSLDADLETIILKALGKDPERRYQAASELAADIGRFLANEPITARPPTAAYQLRKLAQRHKPLVAAAVASLLILILALVAVSISLVQTSRARDAAQRRFDQVHALARTFIYDIHDDIANLPGATKARERLVDTALQYLDSLANDADDDRNLLLDLAAAYERIGDVQGNADVPNLGDLPGALASYRKSLAIRQSLFQADRADILAKRGIGLSHERIGGVQMYLGETAAGVDSFRRALETLDRVAERIDTDQRTEVLRDVGALQMKLGRALIVTGQDDAARQSIAEGLATRRTLTARHPDRQDLQRELSQSHVSLGDEYRYAKNLDAALAEYRAAETIRARLVEFQPGNSTALRDLGIVLNRIGNIQRDTADLGAALATYTRYHDICRQLADADPSNAEATRDLSVSLEKLAAVRQKDDQPDEAIPYYNQCIGVRQALVSQYPDNARFVQDLSIALQLRGNAHIAAGRPAVARLDYQRALDLRIPLAEADPANARLENLIMSAHYKIADSHAAEGDDESRSPAARADSYRAARASFERALDIIDQLKEADRLPPSSADLPDQIQARIQSCTMALDTLTQP